MDELCRGNADKMHPLQGNGDGEVSGGDHVRSLSGEADEALKYRLQFRQRALLYTLQKEQLLKPQLQAWGWERIRHLPESFLFENCGYYKEYQELLAVYAKALKESGRECGDDEPSVAAYMPFSFCGGIYRWRILYLRAKSMGQ